MDTHHLVIHLHRAVLRIHLDRTWKHWRNCPAVFEALLSPPFCYPTKPKATEREIIEFEYIAGGRCSAQRTELTNVNLPRCLTANLFFWRIYTRGAAPVNSLKNSTMPISCPQRAHWSSKGIWVQDKGKEMKSEEGNVTKKVQQETKKKNHPWYTHRRREEVHDGIFQIIFLSLEYSVVINEKNLIFRSANINKDWTLF